VEGRFCRGICDFHRFLDGFWWWICGDFVVILWWICGGFVVDLWWICGGFVVDLW